jgi:hypothetical protein
MIQFRPETDDFILELNHFQLAPVFCSTTERSMVGKLAG